ncbi:MAG: hypothetical protein HYV27_16185 [Candidatus Hydrogenedentes bacterium]|nr:hypothetical protein [Candidatus Hydrogenedentota bacterium]
MIDGPDLVLPILTLDDDTGWEFLLDLAGTHLDRRGLDRLKSALEHTVKTILVERHYIDKDYRETFSSYHSKKFHTPDARCIRLHFFSDTIERSALHSANEMVARSYLGYSVLRPTRPNCIGRTLLRPEARPGWAGHLCLCEESVYIQGLELRVSGFPFISQDGDATVCAQATLWMLMRYFSNRYPAYPEVYPVEIGNLTRDYSVGRLLPTAGLYVWQMAEALRQVKFAPLVYDRGSFPVSFDHLLYTYIESGIPVLAAFEKHVVMLFGHQSDFSEAGSTLPVAPSPFVFSSQFNRSFIGNDDNGIPYQFLRQTPLGVAWEEMSGGDASYGVEDIRHFIAPLPERVFLPAESFQSLVHKLLVSDEFGFATLSPRILAEPPVLRLFLTTGRGFKKRLSDRDNMGHLGVISAYRDLPLPHFIWVCEISHGSLYPWKVLGEVIWDATRNPYEENAFLAVHYPELLIVDMGTALNRESDVIELALGGSVPYPIYEHNLRERTT